MKLTSICFRSIKEKLARGVPPSEGDHLDDIFDMEAELRELALEVSNTRLKLARKAISEQEAIGGYKDARDAARVIFRKTRDLLSIPCEEDVSYRLENATVKMKASMTEYEEESNSLLLLLRSLIPSLSGEKSAQDDGRRKVTTNSELIIILLIDLFIRIERSRRCLPSREKLPQKRETSKDMRERMKQMLPKRPMRQSLTGMSRWRATC
jgi:hypothetical protein